MKCELIRELEMGPSHPDWQRGVKQMLPPGTVIEHPEAFKLVRMGAAIPADMECQTASGMTADQMRSAQYAYERLNRGIHPDDFDAYDAGEMDGYDEHGNPTIRGESIE